MAIAALGAVGWQAWAVVGLSTYIFLCSSTRHYQRRAMERRFGFKTRTTLANMTLKEAYAIQTWLAEQEFPSVFSASIFFALFKTYGIPSISKLLVATGQFGKPGDVRAMSKRVADTSVLLTNMIVRPPGSKQAMEAVARTNYLHSSYRRAGKISDDDMLYTLSLFVLEAIRWTDKYEWRRLTDMERCAMATCFKVWGEDMEIPYSRLPSYQQGGWADGLAWLEELDAWSRQYEERYLAPSSDNAQVAGATMDFILCRLPWGFKSIGQGIVSVILGPRLQDAMKLPSPPSHSKTIFSLLISARKLALRYAVPPRPYFLRRIYNVDDPDPSTGRYQAVTWRVYPWYARPSFRDRWGPGAWLAWIMGGEYVDLTAKDYVTEGYMIREVGPVSQIGKGEKDMNATVEKLTKADPARCPFGLLGS
ncbi:hypothetical protein B0H66DRAFT_478055 [Apodospora peruviana]|uniref:ER-bound oxygenase mpaB/mpaB'/Rubber oxygenase catalytic domain-containing protein n=1 Tax=Apodospora peruviana TaxID=516989 RepID=A0AAE0I4F3_9PEZI|nr:hypothetical protein B0H66DRAFT_478055 [Apodospora peruviana]